MNWLLSVVDVVILCGFVWLAGHYDRTRQGMGIIVCAMIALVLVSTLGTFFS